MKGHRSSLRDDSCGCATGAKFMVIALLGSLILGGIQFRHGHLSGGAFTGRVFLATFCAAGAGKLVGIGLYRSARRKGF